MIVCTGIVTRDNNHPIASDLALPSRQADAARVLPFGPPLSYPSRARHIWKGQWSELRRKKILVRFEIFQDILKGFPIYQPAVLGLRELLGARERLGEI